MAWQQPPNLSHELYGDQPSSEDNAGASFFAHFDLEPSEDLVLLPGILVWTANQASETFRR